ncbi:P-loop NTPase fold protein [Sphingobacterium sp. 1.A.5]|uniref:P-loop NTPase fold protein n=1 Tax=Sphingobacterium sp. 1.A.5 TaxID=2044604 RepID=UPI000C0C0D4C|nr:P-loop NTPase fold protein [Sphingobacterium sp. 1.A.5]
MSNPFEANIDNKEILQEFLSFISPNDNVDIILSAPFGAGKTYFLKNDFFLNTKEIYNVFHLFPVNYSVSSNEDIMELIKYDLLQECLVNHFNVIENDDSLGFSSALKLSFFLSEKFNIIDFSTGVLEKLNNLFSNNESEILEHSVKLTNFLNKEWNKFKTKSQVKTEETIIEDFFKSFSNKKGIYENDDFTKFIRSFLMKLKNNEEENPKKNILIIDDLDRIDPEHIFRLFNVFSAQKNYTTNNHKFGFDKIIFVCDINNIRKIYQHKYGRDVDFWGYVSKFISRRVYHFDSKNQVIKNIRSVLYNAKYNQHLDNEFLLNESYQSTHLNLISSILSILLYLERISLRDILKIEDMVIKQEEFYSIKSKKDRLVLFIDKAIGGKGNFREIIKSLNSSGLKFNYINLGLDNREAEGIFINIIKFIVSNDIEFDLEMIAKGNTSWKIQDEYYVTVEEYNNQYTFKLQGYENGRYESFDLIKYLNENIN